MKVKPIELKGCYQQVNSLYRNVAYAFYKERSLTRLAVRICMLITIFETKLIPCCNVGKSVKSSMVRKSHDPNVADALASDMDNLVKSCWISQRELKCFQHVQDIRAHGCTTESLLIWKANSLQLA